MAEETMAVPFVTVAALAVVSAPGPLSPAALQNHADAARPCVGARRSVGGT
jgi:hypothetical protein